MTDCRHIPGQTECAKCRGERRDHCRVCGARIPWPRLTGALIFGDRTAECAKCAHNGPSPTDTV